MPLNPENNALMGTEKIIELRHQIIQTIHYIKENKDKLDAAKTKIFEKLDQILSTKENLMTYLQKSDLDSEIKRRPQPQDYYKSYEYDKLDPFEFEKKVFFQKLEIILKKLDNDILLIKFKKLGNNFKAFCFVWDTLFTVYIYIEKSKSKSMNEKNKYYRIFDIVVTNIKDKGSIINKKQIDYICLNDLKEPKELDPRGKISNLKKFFDAHFHDLVFEPDSVFFQRITFFIRKIFFKQKLISNIEFEYLVVWHLNGYKQFFTNEDVKCNFCKNKMVFDSAKIGFLPCTIFKNNKFYHDKCFIQK